jgi:hypothetical protein
MPNMMIIKHTSNKVFNNSHIYITLYSHEGINLKVTPSFLKEHIRQSRTEQKIQLIGDLAILKPEDSPFYEYHSRPKPLPRCDFLIANKKLERNNKIPSVAIWENR